MPTDDDAEHGGGLGDLEAPAAANLEELTARALRLADLAHAAWRIVERVEEDARHFLAAGDEWYDESKRLKAGAGLEHPSEEELARLIATAEAMYRNLLNRSGPLMESPRASGATSNSDRELLVGREWIGRQVPPYTYDDSAEQCLVDDGCVVWTDGTVQFVHGPPPGSTAVEGDQQPELAPSTWVSDGAETQPELVSDDPIARLAAADAAATVATAARRQALLDAYWAGAGTSRIARTLGITPEGVRKAVRTSS